MRIAQYPNPSSPQSMPSHRNGRPNRRIGRSHKIALAAGLPDQLNFGMSWSGRPKGEFTAHEISLGFELMSAHLRNNPPEIRLPVTIVVAGGAVSTLLFRNRKATKDVDFWAPDR
ncbi:hypothetical protein RSAG8_00176, partial [Rhizoctonia solani AG-8 WAC10335]